VAERFDPTDAKKGDLVIQVSLILCILLVVPACTSTPGGESKDEMMKYELRPCPSSPNCVSSRSKSKRSAIPPLYFSSSIIDAQQAIRRLIQGTPGARITCDKPGTIRAEFSSRVFKFVDDVDFVLDPETRRIDYRSASRTGYYDFGVNRRRLESFRNRLAQSSEVSTEPLSPTSTERDIEERNR
jgi:uncharacterized protein (DUF1499 family)